MKYSLAIILFGFFSYSFSQNTLRFDNKKMYLGDLDVNNVYSVTYHYENISNNSINLSYEPITNLINATFTKDSILPGNKGSLKINFYPEHEGPFFERLYIIVNDKEKTELSIYGSVKSISPSYKSLTESNKLFGDRDIAFMVVDAQTFEGIPHAKVFIKNSINQKSYIGVANRFGVLINRIPEGKYLVQALVKEYGKEVLDIKLDANKNIAYILLDKPELQDTSNSLSNLNPGSPSNNDSIINLSNSENQNLSTDNKEINTKAPYYEPHPEYELENKSPLTIVNRDSISKKSRKTLNLILLIDVSKSMEISKRINQLKKSIIHLVENYQQEDFMAILTFNDNVHELMERGQIVNKENCIKKINSIMPSGSTDGVLGIDKAFEILQKNYMPDAINMVIIASDGKINKYAYDDKSMLERVEKMNENGILTSVICFGNSLSYKSKLQQMAEVGGGVFIDMTREDQSGETIIFDDIYSTLLQVK